MEHYYASSGLGAWEGSDAVPNWISTNAFAAHSLAATIEAAVRDTEEQLGRKARVTVLEVGAGVGILGYRVIRSLQSRPWTASRLRAGALRVVLSDLSESIVGAWERMEAWGPFLESRTVDFAVLDASGPLDAASLRCRRSGEPVVRDDDDTVVLLGTYLADSLPCDAFRLLWSAHPGPAGAEAASRAAAVQGSTSAVATVVAQEARVRFAGGTSAPAPAPGHPVEAESDIEWSYHDLPLGDMLQYYRASDSLAPADALAASVALASIAAHFVQAVGVDDSGDSSSGEDGGCEDGGCDDGDGEDGDGEDGDGEDGDGADGDGEDGDGEDGDGEDGDGEDGDGEDGGGARCEDGDGAGCERAHDDHAGASVESATWTVPIGTIRLLSEVRRLCGSSRAVVAVLLDKGYADPDTARGAGEPEFALHGSFSMMVNMFALQAFAERSGGFGLTSRGEDYDIRTCVLAWPGDGAREAGAGTETRAWLAEHAEVVGLCHAVLEEESAARAAPWPSLLGAFQEHGERFGPDAIDNLHELSVTAAVALSDRAHNHESPRHWSLLPGLLAACGAAHWDPGVLASFYTALSALVADAPGTLLDRLHLGLVRANQMDYGLSQDEDVGFMGGRLMQHARRPDDAAAFFLESWRRRGAHPATAFNLGLCRYALGDVPDSLEWFDRALALDPHFDEAREWGERARGHARAPAPVPAGTTGPRSTVRADGAIEMRIGNCRLVLDDD